MNLQVTHFNSQVVRVAFVFQKNLQYRRLNFFLKNWVSSLKRKGVQDATVSKNFHNFLFSTLSSFDWNDSRYFDRCIACNGICWCQTGVLMFRQTFFSHLLTICWTMLTNFMRYLFSYLNTYPSTSKTHLGDSILVSTVSHILWNVIDCFSCSLRTSLILRFSLFLFE